MDSSSGLTTIRAEPFNAEAPLTALEAPITPTSLHFVRRNFALPEHDGQLTIGGAVASPFTLTIGDLCAMHRKELVVTLECAGNARLGQMPLPVGEPWTGNAVSTARWTGVLLSEVLEKAEPSDGGVAVSFEGADQGPSDQEENRRGQLHPGRRRGQVHDDGREQADPNVETQRQSQPRHHPS